MIRLTKLGGEEFVLNAELIQYVDSRPDTYVTLTTSDRYLVRESVAEVVKRCLAYRQVLRLPVSRRDVADSICES